MSSAEIAIVNNILKTCCCRMNHIQTHGAAEGITSKHMVLQNESHPNTWYCRINHIQTHGPVVRLIDSRCKSWFNSHYQTYVEVWSKRPSIWLCSPCSQEHVMLNHYWNNVRIISEYAEYFLGMMRMHSDELNNKG